MCDANDLIVSLCVDGFSLCRCVAATHRPSGDGTKAERGGGLGTSGSRKKDAAPFCSPGSLKRTLFRVLGPSPPHNKLPPPCPPDEMVATDRPPPEGDGGTKVRGGCGCAACERRGQGGSKIAPRLLCSPPLFPAAPSRRPTSTCPGNVSRAWEAAAGVEAAPAGDGASCCCCPKPSLSCTRLGAATCPARHARWRRPHCAPAAPRRRSDVSG